MDAAALRPYAPRVLLEWLRDDPDTTWRELDASVVFADISGFTKLSERLAGSGRVGAEELTDAISRCFDALLAVAYADGASLLKFGGDATLLLFTGADHATRACRAAAGMRRTLRELGPVQTSRHNVTLRISLGVHTGTFAFFLVGDSHRELVLTGPAFSTVVDMESTADAGEVVISPATAAALPPRAVGAAKGPGFLLAGSLQATPVGMPGPVTGLEVDTVAQALPTAVRGHLLSGVDEPEHRRVTVAFLHFDGTDALLQRSGPEALSRDLGELVGTVTRAADRHGVCLLGSDVDHDGGKLILVSGAPTATGEDEERMLLALHEIASTALAVPVRVGLHAGPVFVGSVGPHYRRTFTVMGDAVNLAARVMGKAVPGQVLATGAVLNRCAVRFDTTALEPFFVKGKTAAVQAYAVGEPHDDEPPRSTTATRLVGREEDLGTLQALLAEATAGQGRLVEVVGEAGLGKSRLVEELLDRAPADVRVLRATCTAYQALTPYYPFRALLRQALGLALDASPGEAGEVLLRTLRERAPDLLPWAPLIALPLRAEVPPTPEVDRLDEGFVRDRLHTVVTYLLGVVLDGPTLVAVDDVHWSDEASSEVLLRIARDVAAGPWLICVTRRDTGTGFVAPEGPHVRVLRPDPLDAAAALALAEEYADADPAARHLSPHDLAALATRSGGNPLLLGELVAGAGAAGGVDQLPDTVEALVMARIDRLAPPDRALLRRLAVFGPAADQQLLAAALGEEAPPAEDPVWRRLGEFVTSHAGTLRFEHALVRDAAYGSLPFRVRQDLHARIGTALAQRAGGGVDAETVGLLSLHFFHGRQDEQAWRYSTLAAEHARAVHANAEAVDLFGRAVTAVRRGAQVPAEQLRDVHVAIGDLHSRLGKYDAATHAYRAARALTAEEDVLARLLLKEGELRQRFGHYPAALRWLRRARAAATRLAATDPVASQRLLGEVFIAYAAVAKDQARHRDTLRWCRRAMDVAEAVGDRATLARASSVHDGSASVLGRFDLARHGDRALELYTELGDRRGQGMAHSNLGLLAIIRGRWDEGLAHWDASQQALREVGDEVNVAIISANMAEARLEQGRLDEADRFARQALRVWGAAGDRASVAYAGRLQARVLARLGDLDAALARFERAREEFLAVQAEDEARETLARQAEALVLHGLTADAEELLAQVRAGRGDLEAMAPLLHRVSGVAAAQRGDLDRARTELLASLAVGQEAEMEVEVAQTLRTLGRLAALQGQDAQAREWQERAGAMATTLGVVSPADPPLTAG